MADSRVQSDVADWVRSNWLAEHFGQSFEPRQLLLSGGGHYKFSAVSQDQSIVCSISTSERRTASGNNGVGKLQKIRSDMLFLLMCTAPKKFVVVTDIDMFDQLSQEKENGRLPPNIAFLHVPLPQELSNRLADARRTASEEVSPQRRQP